MTNAEQLRKAFEAQKLAKANQTTLKVLKGKFRLAQEPSLEQEKLKNRKQMHEEKLKRTEERRQRILEAKVAKAAAKALKIQQIKERKQSILTECSSGEEPTQFETMKLMNLKQKESKLELKMARVAENKQKILEERKERARRSYESFFKIQRANSAEDQNGWEKAPNGYVKVFKPLKSVPFAKDKKFSKDDLDHKMARVAMRKQMILAEKKQKAR